MKARLLIIAIFLASALFGQTNIAVIDFSGNNVSVSDARALTDRLRATLFMTGKFVILEREKMDEILKEQGFQQSGCTSDACAVEVGQLLAVEQMIVGSISKVGQTYSVTARLVGMEKGSLISVGTCDLKGDIGDVMTCLGDVADQLSGKQPVPRSAPNETQMNESTSTSELKKEAIQTGTVTDIDGNTYKTVKIGDQWWMAENLKVTHYRNGDAIPNVTDNLEWSGLISGAYCNYANDINKVATYGRLYNWYAVNDSRNLAPLGWHMPPDSEWDLGEGYGGEMKQAGTKYWNSPNRGATNESGFSALPGGYRGGLGDYVHLGHEGYWWSATELGRDHAWDRNITMFSSILSRSPDGKNFGFSVRCVRD
ncbi:MAG: FISUMP domain-containing protein [archaeon]